ncbi:Peptide chain release factor 1 [bacterium HR19]|nr:Peptide chain release factor 1 [bacterium HR19]
MIEKAKTLIKNLENIKKEIEQIDLKLSSEFDQSLLEKRGKLEEKLEKLEKLKEVIKELEDVEDVIKSESDPELISLAVEEKKNLEKELSKLIGEFEQVSSKNSCIVEIRAGVGGEEAALFAGDLFRMYSKFADKKGWKIKMIYERGSDLGGIKEMAFIMEGKGVYDFMKNEAGVHRVQRVPVTESSGRIHTSTATVAVLEEPEDVQVNISPQDIIIETFRASGPGGQHVNKTDSAVRIKHIPTGIVVTCQEERSQHMNKEKALRLLKAKLFQIEKEKQERKILEERKQQIGSAERSEKVRTYNFMQNRVTDHRLGITIYRLDDILDGNLDLLFTGM